MPENTLDKAFEKRGSIPPDSRPITTGRKRPDTKAPPPPPPPPPKKK